MLGVPSRSVTESGMMGGTLWRGGDISRRVKRMIEHKAGWERSVNWRRWSSLRSEERWSGQAEEQPRDKTGVLRGAGLDLPRHNRNSRDTS